jgi:hypothetical protein
MGGMRTASRAITREGQFRDSVDALRAAAAYLDARDAEAIETAKLVRARARLLRDVSV